MGLFGGNWRNSLRSFSRGLSDIGSTLEGQDGHAVSDFQAQQLAAKQRQQQADAWTGLQSAFGGADNQLPAAQAGGGSMDQIAGYAQGQRGAPVNPLQALLDAQRAGIDTKDLYGVYNNQVKLTTPKPHNYQFLPGRDGAIGRGDQSTGDYTQVQAATAPQIPDKVMTISNGDGSQTVLRVPMAGQGGQGGYSQQPMDGPPQLNTPQLADVQSQLLAALPGARITSGYRTPEHNKDVGGVNNSMHTTGDGQALDFVPPPGMTMDQALAKARALGLPLTETLNEGDHVHIGWRPKGGQSQPPQLGQGGVQTLYTSQPKALAAPKVMYRPATAEEKAANGVSAETPAQVSPDGKFEVTAGVGAGLKPVPAGPSTNYADNNAAMQKIDVALAAVRSQPDAFGVKNAIPWFSRYDSEGITPRAEVGDIGSLIIHDRSGAAVTVSESPRLEPFVPKATDTPEQVRKKLIHLRQNLAQDNAALEDVYGPDSGYRPLGGRNTAQPQGLSPAPSGPPKKADQFVVGQVYEDANGNKATYRGNGKFD